MQVIRLLALALFMLSAGISASAQQKRALLIGVDDYSAQSPLQYVEGGIREVQASLESLGFTPTVMMNPDYRELRFQIVEFSRSVSPGDEVVVFISGNGFTHGSHDYLALGSADYSADVGDLVLDSMSVNAMLGPIRERFPTILVAAIDIGRPFVGASPKGLLPTPTNRGELVIYSAEAGQNALSSPVFADSFARNLATPGISIQEVAQRVRLEVIDDARTRGATQVPVILDNFTFAWCPTGSCFEANSTVKAVSTRDPVREAFERARNNCDLLAAFEIMFPEHGLEEELVSRRRALFCDGAFDGTGPEVRLALVISQGNYEHMRTLSQTELEADAVETALKSVDFDVRRYDNLSKQELNDALTDFRRDAERAGGSAIVFVYYTGHGVQNPKTGHSYLLGVDADLEVLSDLTAFGINLMGQRDAFADIPAKAVFLVFDACRDTGGLKDIEIDNGAKSAIPKGLGRLEAKADMLIAYSTSENDVAIEGNYAPILSEEIMREGILAGAVFDNTQRRVAQNTNRDQLPWTNNLIYDDICFAACEEALP